MIGVGVGCLVGVGVGVGCLAGVGCLIDVGVGCLIGVDVGCLAIAGVEKGVDSAVVSSFSEKLPFKKLAITLVRALSFF